MEYINKSVCRGVAGRRQGNVKGVVIHNDAGSVYATAEAYVKSLSTMTNSQLANGFAHYYIDKNTTARVEDTYNMAWHTANTDGNANYIGYEVCQSMGATDEVFLMNEQAVFKQVAEDLKFYGLAANRNTVRLHREFVPTACPHRSWDLHGKSVNAVKDYFIQEIKKYMNGKGDVSTVTENTKKHWVKTGYYTEGYEANKKVKAYLDKNKMGYKTKKDGKKITYIVGWFGQGSSWKRQLEDFLVANNFSYSVHESEPK